VPREKRLVIAMDHEPKHLNPLLRISPWGYRVAMYNIYEPLLRRDPDTHQPAPHLATRWTVSPDGKVYRFTLRKDVRWHDGKPLSARDVWYTLGRIHDRDTPMGPFRKALINELHQVDPLSSHEVRITLARPNSYLLDHLCEVPVLPYHRLGRSVRRSSRISRRPMGTGPFRFEGWTRSKEIRLVRNERYWGGVPEVHEVVFRWIRNPAKALTDLKRGVVDVLPEVARQHYPDQLTAWAQRRFRQVWFAPPGFDMFLWNTRHPLLKDFRVRRAFTMLMDRQRIIKEVYHGLARPVAGPFWRPAGLGDPKLEPWPYDPVRARNLLDNAGWRDRDGDKIRDLNDRPLRVVLLRPVTSTVMDDELKVMMAEFKRSGVALEPVQTDWRRLMRLLRTGNFMGAALSWRGRPAEDLSPLFHSAGGKNFGKMGSLTIDKLLSKMRVSTSRVRRAEYSRKLERALWAQQSVTFLHGPRFLMLIHRRFDRVMVSSEWLHIDKLRLVPFDDPAHGRGVRVGAGGRPRPRPRTETRPRPRP
jgi:peptide/nickel transport system substrate-binding protein